MENKGGYQTMIANNSIQTSIQKMIEIMQHALQNPCFTTKTTMGCWIITFSGYLPSRSAFPITSTLVCFPASPALKNCNFNLLRIPASWK